MSTFDNYAAQRRAEAEPVVLDEHNNVIPAGSDGTGYVVGVALAVIGGVLIFFVSLVGAISLGVGLLIMAIFAGSGEKSNNNTMRDMHQEAANKNTEGVTAAAGGGCVNIVVLGCIAMLIALLVIAKMKEMGL